MTTEIAAKSLRRAQTTINEVGAEAVAVILQSKLIANDVISQPGLSVQLKTKPQPPTSQ
jgi:hypothetical protein